MSRKYFDQGRALAVKIGWPRGEAAYYVRRGILQEDRGRFADARTMYDSAHAIYSVNNMTQRYYSLCINVGNTYYIQGLYDKALPWFIKASEGALTVKDTNTASQGYMNIGNIYFDQKKLEQAKEYYNKAIPLAQKSNSLATLGSLWNNLGAIEFERKNYSEALEYFQKGLEVRTILEPFESGRAGSYSNLAECYFKLGEVDKAMNYYQLAQRGFDSINDVAASASNSVSMGYAFFVIGKKQEGIMKMKAGLAMAEEIGDLPTMYMACERLAEVYKTENDYVNAHFYLERFTQLKDSIHASQSSEILLEMQTRYDTDQKEKENELLRQEASLKAAEESAFRKSIFGIVIILIIAAAGLTLTIVFKQRSNRILAAKNALIEEQKKEITDSINYARRIQQAILPPVEELKKHFPDSFVFYLPKAIVSGDFWWMLEKENLIFVAVADCTGHGVPGAFMSMLGMEMLNDISRETNDPSTILAKLSDGIKRSLRQSSGETQTTDGMDICLCCFDKKKREIIYAGANRPLWIRSLSGKLNEYHPTKAPIGGSAEDHQVYVSSTIKLEVGEQVYLFTDGMADQFGGDKGKKLKTSGLRALLESTSANDAQTQEAELKTFFEKWQGSLEQVDDVLIVGIRT